MGVPSSLVLYRESVTADSELLLSGRTCPRKLGLTLYAPITGELLPVRCGLNTCAPCASNKAYGIGLAIALAKPQRFLTLTQVGSVPQEIRLNMRQLKHSLKSSGYNFDWAWHCEPNPAGTGNHAHASQRGDFIPQRVLSEHAFKVGMGKVVDIRAYTAPDGPLGYGMKLVGMPYGMKTLEDLQGHRAYLEVNGGRLVHTSRGFWLDEHGNSCGQDEAIAAALQVRYGDSEGEQWHCVKKTQVARAAAYLSALPASPPPVE